MKLRAFLSFIKKNRGLILICMYQRVFIGNKVQSSPSGSDISLVFKGFYNRHRFYN